MRFQCYAMVCALKNGHGMTEIDTCICKEFFYIFQDQKKLNALFLLTFGITSEEVSDVAHGSFVMLYCKMHVLVGL